MNTKNSQTKRNKEVCHLSLMLMFFFIHSCFRFNFKIMSLWHKVVKLAHFVHTRTRDADKCDENWA